MITRRARLQLVAFAVVTVLILWYGATNLFHVGEVVSRPWELRMQVASSAGLYPRADVDLLGTRVGRVTDLQPGPGRGTTVVMAIDHDVTIPVDVHGLVAAKSAIGEGYVSLTPKSDEGPALADGDVIPLSRTDSPVPLDSLLANLDDLVTSIPLKDLDTVLRESEKALDGISPSVGRLLSGSQRLTSDALANVEQTTELISGARTVLGTQVELGQGTRAWAAELAPVTAKLRELDPTLVSLYSTGLDASTSVTNLLADNQAALPVLLANLVTLTTVAEQRTPELRKTLAVFPWILENQANSARYCDDYDPQTGQAVQDTCHYDDQGRPIYTLHLAQQLDQLGANPYQSCTRGYEGTRKYQPDLEPTAGSGEREQSDEPPNLTAHCGSAPSDPKQPNVRGAQNVTTPAYARHSSSGGPRGRLAAYDPSTGLVTDGDAAVQLSGLTGSAPPRGRAGLTWLLTHLLEDPS